VRRAYWYIVRFGGGEGSLCVRDLDVTGGDEKFGIGVSLRNADGLVSSKGIFIVEADMFLSAFMSDLPGVTSSNECNDDKERHSLSTF
jgi:hypothetical protein